MDREQSWRVVDEHRVRVADFLAGLEEQQWETASLCDGWRVRDVGAHLSLAAKARMGEVFGAVVRSRGNFDRMIRDVSIERGQRPTAEIEADLRSIVGSRKLAPLTFWRDPLLDILVHAQDMARPLGLTLETPPEAAREAADWAWRRGFPFFPSRRLRGVRLVAEDVDWQRGSGEELRGPIVDLLLLSTGRPAGLVQTAGPGREVLEDRFARSA